MNDLKSQIDVASARALVLRERCRRSLAYYARYMWDVIEPGVELKWNWHLDALSEHLEAAFKRDIKRLIISMPPRSLKSTFVSVLFPSWVWLHAPQERFLTASYAAKLAINDAVKSRRIMQSEHYAALRPDWEFTSDQNEKTKYENTKSGYRMITTPTAATTGFGGNFLILDDPHNVRDVESDDIREGTVSWCNEAWPSRMNNPENDVQIIMAQRTHEMDTTGSVLAAHGDKWEHLCLPTMYESAFRSRPTKLGFSDPRTIEGELLSPKHFGPAAVEEARERMGPWAFDAQHQQRPSGIRGSIFDLGDFAYYEGNELPARFDRMFQSWDFAFKGKSESKERERIANPSYVVGQIWGMSGSRYYLLDQVRGQWDFARSLLAVEDVCQRYDNTAEKLIEDKANGSAIISALKGKVNKLVPVLPSGSKIERARAIQHVQQLGQIYLPRRAPWLAAFLAEVKQFPFGQHDDQVDAMTQAVNYWLMRGGNAKQRLLRLVAR